MEWLSKLKGEAFQGIENSVLQKVHMGPGLAELCFLTFGTFSSSTPLTKEEIEIIKNTEPDIFPDVITFKRGYEVLVQYMPKKTKIICISDCNLDLVDFPELDVGCGITIVFCIEQIDSDIFDRLPINTTSLRLELIVPPADMFFDRIMDKKFMNLPPSIKNIDYIISSSSMASYRNKDEKDFIKLTDKMKKNITEYFPISDSLERISLNEKVGYSKAKAKALV